MNCQLHRLGRVVQPLLSSMSAGGLPLRFRDEFRCRSWGFGITPAELSVGGRSSQCTALMFSVWRLVAAAYLLAVLVWALTDSALDDDIECE